MRQLAVCMCYQRPCIGPISRVAIAARLKASEHCLVLYTIMMYRILNRHSASRCCGGLVHHSAREALVGSPRGRYR